MLEEIAKRIASYNKELLILNNSISLYKSKSIKISVDEYISKDIKRNNRSNYVIEAYNFMNQFEGADLTIDYSRKIEELTLKKNELIKQYELDMANFKSSFCSSDNTQEKSKSFWDFLKI
jgi:uncharacterized protein VirK/YbjX